MRIRHPMIQSAKNGKSRSRRHTLITTKQRPCTVAHHCTASTESITLHIHRSVCASATTLFHRHFLHFPYASKEKRSAHKYWCQSHTLQPKQDACPSCHSPSRGCFQPCRQCTLWSRLRKTSILLAPTLIAVIFLLPYMPYVPFEPKSPHRQPPGTTAAAAHSASPLSPHSSCPHVPQRQARGTKRG